MYFGLVFGFGFGRKLYLCYVTLLFTFTAFNCTLRQFRAPKAGVQDISPDSPPDRNTEGYKLHG